MGQHPIQSLMQTAMENIKQMVDVNTIIGDPIKTPDGQVIIPVSKVGFGFAAGGSEFKTPKMFKDQCQDNDIEKNSQNQKHPFGGGSGGGVSITPVAFIVVNGKEIKLLNMQGTTHLYDRLIDLVDKVATKKKKDDAAEEDPPQMYC